MDQGFKSTILHNTGWRVSASKPSLGVTLTHYIPTGRKYLLIVTVCDGEAAVVFPLFSYAFLTAVSGQDYFHHPHLRSLPAPPHSSPLFPSREAAPALRAPGHPRAEGDKAAAVPPLCPKAPHAPHVPWGPVASVTPLSTEAAGRSGREARAENPISIQHTEFCAYSPKMCRRCKLSGYWERGGQSW